MNKYCEPCKCEIEAKPFRHLEIHDVISKCCQFFQVTSDYIMKRNRKRERVIIRQMSMYACKLYTGSSLEDIGYHFLKRDHTTVIHAINTVNDLCDTDDFVRKRFENLKFFVRN